MEVIAGSDVRVYFFHRTWSSGFQAYHWSFIEIVSHSLFLGDERVLEVCIVLECGWFGDLLGWSSCSGHRLEFICCGLRAVCSSLRCLGSAACGLWLVSSFNMGLFLRFQ